jgi:AcrR family transcriptional regulator
MTRARTGILDGAARCLARHGTRKTTMGDIAREGGVAKATLYNHFRAKPDVYAALLAREVDRLLAELAAVPVAAGSAESVREPLALAAERVSAHPVLRALATREPELAAVLAVPSGAAEWTAVRRFALHRVSLAQAAGALHAQHDAAAVVETLLRWVVSHVLWPEPPAACAAGARQLVHGLLASPYAGPVPAPVAATSITA